MNLLTPSLPLLRHFSVHTRLSLSATLLCSHLSPSRLLFTGELSTGPRGYLRISAGRRAQSAAHAGLFTHTPPVHTSSPLCSQVVHCRTCVAFVVDGPRRKLWRVVGDGGAGGSATLEGVAWGAGLAGHVAADGVALRLRRATKHEAYNAEVDDVKLGQMLQQHVARADESHVPAAARGGEASCSGCVGGGGPAAAALWWS